MANKTIIAAKEAKVKSLSEELSKSNLILLVDYRGITVEDDTKLRKNLRDAKGINKVVKNNILKRALDNNKQNDFDKEITGPTAVILSEDDYLAPLKVIYKYSKEHENYQIKGGYIDGKAMSKDEIIELAKLPSREELLSKLAGSLLQTIAKAAVALDQVRIKKESEEGAEATKTEETAKVTETVEEEEPAKAE